MTKQAVVIGLGQFGMALARSLSEKGMEVLAVDSREDRVRQAAAFSAEAAAFDATDAEALARGAPQDRDVSVCAIGADSRESSIICTALLVQMGAPRVVSRAIDPLHGRILRLVGAHEVVNPEADFGERYAVRIAHDTVIGELALGDDLVITELEAPPSFAGRSLDELRLPRLYGVTVVAVRRAGHGSVERPAPDTRIGERDVLVVVSDPKAVPRLMRQS